MSEIAAYWYFSDTQSPVLKALHIYTEQPSNVWEISIAFLCTRFSVKTSEHAENSRSTIDVPGSWVAGSRSTLDVPGSWVVDGRSTLDVPGSRVVDGRSTLDVPGSWVVELFSELTGLIQENQDKINFHNIFDWKENNHWRRRMKVILDLLIVIYEFEDESKFFHAFIIFCSSSSQKGIGDSQLN